MQEGSMQRILQKELVQVYYSACANNTVVKDLILEANRKGKVYVGSEHFPILFGASTSEQVALEFTKQIKLPTEHYSRVLFKIKLDDTFDLNPFIILKNLSIKEQEQEIVFSPIIEDGFLYMSEFCVQKYKEQESLRVFYLQQIIIKKAI